MLSIRLATVSDLESMTWVLIGASPLDPVYPYRFPDRHLYPGKFEALCRQKCAEYLATSTVVVCEVPSRLDPETMRLVAFAAWDAPTQSYQSNARMLEPLPQPAATLPFPITIGHKARMDEFKAACARNKASMFDALYRRGHMMLKILLCHPDYQRRGAGRALTEWGIEEAQRLGLHTTVFASPMGMELYKKLGFREIGRFKVQLDGDTEYLEIPALVLRPRSGEAPCGVAPREYTYTTTSTTVCV